MGPVIDDHDVTVWQGDARDVLATLPAGSVQCIVTSPPYYGLRDYGVVGQIGLEPSPAEYVEQLRAVFAEARRVLADDGVMWCNLGDSYSGGARATYDTAGGKTRARGHAETRPLTGIPGKNLLGIPWRVAFALQDDDSADVYELRADAPESIKAVYLETCRTKTPSARANITVSTPGSGATLTVNGTALPAQHGTTSTATSSADTAGSTTSCTESKKSNAQCAATRSGTDASASMLCSTTAESSPSASAAANTDSPSSPSTTSTAAEGIIAASCEQQTSACGNGSAGKATQTDSRSSATTATPRVGSTGTARTTKNAIRLPKSEIRPADLQYFRLVRQERWILRNDCIWHKPNAMPESVTDRLSTRYEHVFLFSKSRRYWFGLDAIREPLAYPDAADGTRVFGGSNKAAELTMGSSARRTGNVYGARPDPTPYAPGVGPQSGRAITGQRRQAKQDSTIGRNPGDVWTIPTAPTPYAHFATMPPELVRRCILAGCPESGTVLDPFAGSGTTLMVARKLGRRSVGVELNPGYVDIIRRRIGQEPLMSGEVV